MATGKNVVVIGGGDTGSDCVGTSNRHGAASVTQFELMPMPPQNRRRTVALTWPYWPYKLRTSSSHEEGCEREFAIATKEFIGGSGKDKGKLVGAAHRARSSGRTARWSRCRAVRRTSSAIWFCWPWASSARWRRCLRPSASSATTRGNAKAPAPTAAGAYKTNVDKVFAAGDMRRGQSLIVWAIREGRQAARAVDEPI